MKLSRFVLPALAAACVALCPVLASAAVAVPIVTAGTSALDYIAVSLFAVAVLMVFLLPARSLPILAALAIFVASPALAQAAGGSVSIPWGDWAYSVLLFLKENIIAGVLLLFAALGRALPSTLWQYVQTARVEQLLTRSLDYGIGAVAGAAKGKTLDLQLSNAVLREAANYAIKNAPGLIQSTGIADTLRAKLFARLAGEGMVDAATDAAAVNAAVPSK